MKERDFEKFQKLIKDIENSKGYKLDSTAYELENSFIVMVINFGELKKLFEDAPVFSVKQKRNGESRKFLINALRVFSNYLASVTSFINHIRNFVNKIYGSAGNAFEGQYQKKIDDEFKNNELAQFIEDIRNLHIMNEILRIGHTVQNEDIERMESIKNKLIRELDALRLDYGT